MQRGDTYLLVVGGGGWFCRNERFVLVRSFVGSVTRRHVGAVNFPGMRLQRTVHVSVPATENTIALRVSPNEGCQNCTRGMELVGTALTIFSVESWPRYEKHRLRGTITEFIKYRRGKSRKTGGTNS